MPDDWAERGKNMPDYDYDPSTDYKETTAGGFFDFFDFLNIFSIFENNHE